MTNPTTTYAMTRCWARSEGKQSLKKVCICGNSHIAALKFALRDRTYVNPQLDFQFWGLPAKKFRTIGYRDGALTTSDARMMREVTGRDSPELELGEYDAIVFHGCEITLTHWLSSIKTVFEDLSEIPDSFLNEGLRSCFEPLHVSQLIRQVTENHEIPVFVSPNPFVSVANKRFKKLRVSVAELERFQRGIALAIEELNGIYLSQPKETIKRCCFTDQKFSDDAQILRGNTDRRRRKNEHNHMNQKYGVSVLAKIVRHLNDMPSKIKTHA